MPRFKINTLGCKVNQSESDTIAKQLQAIDWTPSANNEISEMVLINTCTVTQKAAMQSRQAVRRAIRTNPDARIIVTGCYAQTEPGDLEKISGVQAIIGNADKHRIIEIISNEQLQANGAAVTICSDVRQSRLLKPAPDAIGGNRTRPVFKIQDGCSANCSYCIVPRARGASRSLPLEDVLDGIRSLSDAGFLETVLSGIHLGHYGRDLKPETSLSELLDHIAHSTAMRRVRLSSIEPLEVTDVLIEKIAESGRFCPHLHIPLQSGDDRILSRMKRPYTADAFRRLIHKIHNRIPSAAIGVDILVGFPGETDAAFDNTYRLIRDLPVSYLHVFPFSARPGTPASSFSATVAPNIVKERCAIMRRQGKTKRRNFYRHFIGQSMEVLIESTRHAATGYLKGLTSNYIPVLIDADPRHINRLLSVDITEQVDDALVGIIK